MRRAKGLVIPVGFVLLTLTVMLLVNLSRPDPVMATVVDQMLIGMEGRTGAEVEWVTETGSPRSDFVVIPEKYRDRDVVPMILHEDGTVAVSDGGFGPLAYLVAGVIALGLGFTVELSLRGFGYVRGTGQVGDTPDLDVAESHGFYWRT